MVSIIAFALIHKNTTAWNFQFLTFPQHGDRRDISSEEILDIARVEENNKLAQTCILLDNFSCEAGSREP